MKIKIITTSVLTAAALAIGVTTVVIINQPKTDAPLVQGVLTNQTSDGVVTFTATADVNVLDQLKQHAEVQTKDTQYGPFVDSINGQKSNDGKYWAFYVDGHLAQLGAADYVTKGGETIEWRLE